MSASPDRLNIFYAVPVLRLILIMCSPASGPILLMPTMSLCIANILTHDCADLFAHFHYELGDDSYYPPGSPHLSDYRLFGMFHASTPQHNKNVILQSLLRPTDDGGKGITSTWLRNIQQMADPIDASFSFTPETPLFKIYNTKSAHSRHLKITSVVFVKNNSMFV